MQDFSDDRLLNMLDQNTSFTSHQMEEAMEEIQKRNLLSEFEMKRRFEVGHKRGTEILQEEAEQKRITSEKEQKRQLLFRRLYTLGIIASLIVSLVIWYKTDSFLILALSPITTAAIAFQKRKTIFRN